MYLFSLFQCFFSYFIIYSSDFFSVDDCKYFWRRKAMLVPFKWFHLKRRRSKFIIIFPRPQKNIRGKKRLGIFMSGSGQALQPTLLIVILGSSVSASDTKKVSLLVFLLLYIFFSSSVCWTHEEGDHTLCIYEEF